MNLFSKVTLLVTLLTVPFAGFAMDSDVPNIMNETPGKAAEVTTTAGKGLLALAQENPVIALGIGVATCVTLYGMKRGYNWLYGKPVSKDQKSEVTGAPQGAAATSSTVPTTHEKKRNPQVGQQQAVQNTQKQTSADTVKTVVKAETATQAATSGWFGFGKTEQETGNAERVATYIEKGKINPDNFAIWTKKNKLEAKLLDHGLTLADYQAWVKTQPK